MRALPADAPDALRSVFASRSSPTSALTRTTTPDPRFAGRRVELTIGQPEIIAIALDSGELCARHERSFARHLCITDPGHQGELDRLRGNRRAGPGVDVELRPLSRYDALIPA